MRWGARVQVSSSQLEPASGPAPPCFLGVLPVQLMQKRMASELERDFLGELRRLAARIFCDAEQDVRREHAYKT